MFTTELDLQVLPMPDYWALKQPILWKSPELETTIPVGFVTDLASIPQVLRNILDVNGRSREPAILHDWLYTCQKTSRAFADMMLRKGLLAYGESATTAYVYWSGVRIGGWVPWSERLYRGGGIRLEDFTSVVTWHAAISNVLIKQL